MVRTTVGTIAEAEISVQESESITAIQTDQSATVAQSDSQTTTITAPSGTILSVVGIRLLVQPPSGASSGRHNFTLSGPLQNVRYITATSEATDRILVSEGTIRTATRRASPTDGAAQSAQIRSATADDTNAIDITYSNTTDADQTNTRFIRVLAVERGVTS